jgi:Asp/Glu/hydantoin racemase
MGMGRRRGTDRRDVSANSAVALSSRLVSISASHFVYSTPCTKRMGVRNAIRYHTRCIDKDVLPLDTSNERLRAPARIQTKREIKKKRITFLFVVDPRGILYNHL